MSDTAFLVSAFGAVIPMGFYLILLWRYDRFNREPVSALLRNYFWGALGAVFLTVSLFSTVRKMVPDPIMQDVFFAPVVEEFMKGIFLLWTVSNREFDNLTDGLVYGGAIGLGFGMTENFYYFLSTGNDMHFLVKLIAVRAFSPGLLHCITTGFFGAVLGYAKFHSKKSKLIALPAGYILAVFIHLGWNYFVAAVNSISSAILFITVWIILFILTFRFSIKIESEMIRDELQEEADDGILPIEHIPILRSSDSDLRGWVDEKIRKEYIRAATTLAFRKMQLKNSDGVNGEYYEREVLIYRTRIRKLLQKVEI